MVTVIVCIVIAITIAIVAIVIALLIVIGVKVHCVLCKSGCKLWLYSELLSIIVKIFGDIVNFGSWLTGE